RMTWTFARAAVERLARALRRRDAAEVVSAAALTVALVRDEPDGATARRRAAAMLEAILLDPSGPLPDDVRAAIERAVETLLAHDGPAPDATLAALWHDVAGRLDPVAAPAADV